MARYKSPFPTLTPWGWVRNGDELTEEQAKWLKGKGFANRIEEENIIITEKTTKETKPSTKTNKKQKRRHV
jgi:hypothetical protein